jgi:hypothetical protein
MHDPVRALVPELSPDIAHVLKQLVSQLLKRIPERATLLERRSFALVARPGHWRTDEDDNSGCETYSAPRE